MGKVLIACEESQAVTIEMRRRNILAYSCDILPCSGGFPEWHIQGDVISLITDRKWDMIIAFPPCTYLTIAGNRHFSRRINPGWKVEKREADREKALEFFMKFIHVDCPKVAIENPVGWVNSHYRKPDQIIHPYFFGDPYKKRTCLWLKGLPKLTPTNMLPIPSYQYISNGKITSGKKIGWCEGIKNIKGGQKMRAQARSKTFSGIARAMATQWGALLA